MSAGHEHSFAQTNSTRLKWALLLTGSFLVAEVVGGILTGSLALISDAAHMLTDAVAWPSPWPRSTWPGARPTIA